MRRFQSNPGMQHWIAGKKILRYLQRTKAYMLIYRRTKNLELVGYDDANLGKAKDNYISTSSFLSKMARADVTWKSLEGKDLTVLNSWPIKIIKLSGLQKLSALVLDLVGECYVAYLDRCTRY
ncbi:hypothetical protein L3X38_026056 [Prunus dulcis]|uniref:Uncharacterized protein n=1 Tax=Prunus dulcis TaxID=3755 RepID=A0AAD4W4Q0_PRUDU|nr:hypothetical protein L3X38_026056 [Prunus dulcis]